MRSLTEHVVFVVLVCSGFTRNATYTAHAPGSVPCALMAFLVRYAVLSAPDLGQRLCLFEDGTLNGHRRGRWVSEHAPCIHAHERCVLADYAAYLANFRAESLQSIAF